MSTERDFGRGIVLLRQAAGISQVTLAQRLADHGFRGDGVTVLRMEKGPRQIRLNEAAAIAAVFGYSIDGILRMVNPGEHADQPEPNLIQLLAHRLRRMADELSGSGAS